MFTVTQLNSNFRKGFRSRKFTPSTPSKLKVFLMYNVNKQSPAARQARNKHHPIVPDVRHLTNRYILYIAISKTKTKNWNQDHRPNDEAAGTPFPLCIKGFVEEALSYVTIQCGCLCSKADDRTIKLRERKKPLKTKIYIYESETLCLVGRKDSRSGHRLDERKVLHSEAKSVGSCRNYRSKSRLSFNGRSKEYLRARAGSEGTTHVKGHER